MPNGKIKITIIGAGTMMPTKQYHPAAFLVETKNTRGLLDCGHCTLARLTEMDVDLHSLDFVFVSHFHTDHSADLFVLIHSLWVDRINGIGQEKTLTIIGPAGTEDNYRAWRKIFWKEKREADNYPLKFIEGEKKSKVGDFDFQTFAVTHAPSQKSVAVSLSALGKKIFYSGDIGGDNKIENLAKIAHGADLAIVEGGYNRQTPNHFSTLDAIKLKEKAQISKMICVHLREKWTDYYTQTLASHDGISLAVEKSSLEI